MINIDLISNIQGRFTENINSKNEVNSTKTSEVKDDFKSFFNKEVKNDIKREDKSVDLNRNTEDLTNAEKSETEEIKETLETSLKKINEVIDGKSKDDDIEVEDIIEVINLLSSLLVTEDLKVNSEVNAEQLVNTNLLVKENLKVNSKVNVEELVDTNLLVTENLEVNPEVNVKELVNTNLLITENLEVNPEVNVKELVNTNLLITENLKANPEVNVEELLDTNLLGTEDLEVNPEVNVEELVNTNLLVTENLEVNPEVNTKELVDTNLLGTENLKANPEVNVEELVEDNLGYIKNILSEVKYVVNNSELENTMNFDNKGIMENLKSLGDLINNTLETSKDSTKINLDKENLNKEILNLLNSVSEKDVENFKLPENQSNIKEIISSLVNIKDYNKNIEFVEEPITLDKENFNLKDNIKINIESNNLQTESNNNEFGNLLKGNTAEEVSEDIKEEDRILSKFLVDDNKGTFGNILTPYDRFKNNSVDVIQKPEFINSKTMDYDIIKSVKYMIKNNMEELTVKVYPKELGELTIKILSEEGIMKAEIKATSKEAYSILNANIAEIKHSLSDQNIKIQDVQVAIYNDDTTFFSGKEHSRENQKDNSNSNGKVDSINLNEDESLIIENRIESNVNLLA